MKLTAGREIIACDASQERFFINLPLHATDSLPNEKRIIPFVDMDTALNPATLKALEIGPDELAVCWNDRMCWSIHDKRNCGLRQFETRHA